MAAARQLHAVRLPRWWLEQRRPPRRQPLGLGERLPRGHRVERKLGRVPRAIRDLSGGHRSRRRARRAVLPDARQHRCPKVDLCRNGVGRRPLSHWRPEQPEVQVVLRDGGRFTVDTTWAYRAIDLPQGSFRTNLGNMRVTYNFTPSVFVQSLIQYNDRTNRWSTNLRFHCARDRRHGLVRRLQRHGEPQRVGPDQPRVHRQIHPTVRSASIDEEPHLSALAGQLWWDPGEARGL